MWSGDRPFYSGRRKGKKEKERGGEKARRRERDKHTRRRTHRQMDRQIDNSKLGRGRALHRKTVKEVAGKVTEALL